ncbi:protocadherin Fat 3-like [Carcharodon carcharias]|uniref:protocadherin Fat 3-like n=1 Tax=Carcharodon carcharias TaxID=13397 RepID=UPI001B7DC5FD|nr:protocadherin Fat 3-like [Carcharodon carcharias]
MAKPNTTGLNLNKEHYGSISCELAEIRCKNTLSRSMSSCITRKFSVCFGKWVIVNSDRRQTMKRTALSSIFLFCISHLVSGLVRYAIPEELEQGTFVGNIASDFGLEFKELSDRRLRIISGRHLQYFEVNLNNGILVVNKRIDREELCRDSPTCVIPLEMVTDNPVILYRAEVEIRDINDNSPSFPNGEIYLDIFESTSPGMRFPLEGAHDPDVGVNSIRTYQLSSNKHFVLEVQTRGERKLAELVLKNALDREKEALHHILLTAIDGGSPERSGTARITVAVLDANDNSPIFQQSLYTVSLPENAPVGTLAIKLNATDTDEGSNSDIEYYFSNYNPDKVRDLFSLERKGGNLRVKGLIDFEEDKSFKINIVAKDKGSYAVPVHCTVLVNIDDVNDNAPEVNLMSISSTVREDSQPGTMIAVINVVDLDSGDNGQTNCHTPSHFPFQLKSSFKGSFTLVTSDMLDREIVSKYNIDVLCKDAGSPPLSTNKTILVQVTDINDNPPQFSQPSYRGYVMENNTPGTSIFSVTAVDSDLGKNSHISYCIQDTRIQGVPVLTYISISSENGTIYAQHSFDYEHMKNIQFQVLARDGGLVTLSADVTVNMIILDQNDNAPVIVSPLSHNSPQITVPRSADPGYLVTKVIATDADSGQNARLSYRVVQDANPGMFIAGLSSGEVRTIRRFGSHDFTVQTLVIIVQDNGYPALSTSTTIELSITDANTEVHSDLRSVPQSEEHSSDLAFYIIISLGGITFLLMIGVIVLIAMMCQTDRARHLANCCHLGRNNKNKEFRNPHINSQVATDSKVISNCIEVRGTGSLCQTHSYKLSSEEATSNALAYRPCGPPEYKSYVKNVDIAFSEWIETRANNLTNNTDGMAHSARIFLPRKEAMPSIFLLCSLSLASGHIRYSIPEELEHGAFIGNIVKDLGLTLEELSSRKFRIVSDSSKQYVNANIRDGILFVNERIDREQLCAQTVTCALALEVVIENPVQQYRIDVDILDINDNSPRFPHGETCLEIAESAIPGTRFLLENAHDSDVGTNSVREYHLIPSKEFSLDVQTHGEWQLVHLVLKNSLDREKGSTHQLLLRAIDGGTPELSGTTQITITVVDSNDNAPVFQQSLYTAILMEDAPPETVIIKLNATDLDYGSNSDITYSFSSYNKKWVRERFSINPKSGEIRVKGILDFEETDAYEINVEAKDSGSPPLIAHCTVRVNVMDVNDNAPALTFNSFSSKISEDVQIGTLIALISVTDRDSHKNGQTDCQISPTLPFDLNSSIKNSYRLVVKELLDRESTAEYGISVTCKDHGTPPLFTNRTIVVHLKDINDNAPRFLKSSYTVYAMENNPPGATIGSVAALDPDMDQNSQLSYIILDSQIQGLPVTSYVSMNSETGIIFSQRSFDYEQLKSFEFQIQVRDSGFPSLSSNVTVNVIILDQNDNAPVIISVGSAKITVPRSADPGYLVSKVIASDADSGQNARLFYQLVQTTGLSPFTVSPGSGEVRTTRLLKDNHAISHRLVIRVKDNGHPALSATATVTVTISEQSAEMKHVSVEPHRGLQYSSNVAFYIIITLGLTSFILLIVIIALVITICPTDRSSTYSQSCFLTNCCCKRSLNATEHLHHSDINLQVVPDSNLVTNVLEVRGNGSLSDTYRYKVRSALEPSTMDFMYMTSSNPATPGAIRKLTRTSKSGQSAKSTNIWTGGPSEVSHNGLLH